MWTKLLSSDYIVGLVGVLLRQSSGRPSALGVLARVSLFTPPCYVHLPTTNWGWIVTAGNERHRTNDRDRVSARWIFPLSSFPSPIFWGHRTWQKWGTLNGSWGTQVRFLICLVIYTLCGIICTRLTNYFSLSWVIDTFM